MSRVACFGIPERQRGMVGCCANEIRKGVMSTQMVRTPATTVSPLSQPRTACNMSEYRRLPSAAGFGGLVNVSSGMVE
jgi:hypothetical protein